MNNKKLEIEVNTPPEGFKASLRSRVIVALILAVLFIPAFVLGGWVCLFMFMIALSIILVEVHLAPKKKYGWWIWVATFLIAFSYVYWFILKSNLIGYKADPDNYAFSLENWYSSLDISIIGIATSLIIYFTISMFDKNFTFDDVMYFFLMTILVGLGIQGFYFIRYFPFNAFINSTDVASINGSVGAESVQGAAFQFWNSAELELYVLIGVVANDIFAYFGGIFFGKHKMIERISPKKTWEGFIWGIVFSVVCSCTFGLGCALGKSPMLPYLDLEHWYRILILSLIIPLLGDLGDLSFSLIKRHFGIKDYGNILRGHGGVLDRIDSSIFAMIGVSIIVVFLSHGYNILL